MSTRPPHSAYEPTYPDDQDELLPSSPLASSPGTPGHAAPLDEIDFKVQQVQDQLLSLKRQQDEIERQKRELEELSRKQHEFEDGRAEIVEKLTRGLVLLERQEFEAKRELDQIHLVRENFADQLGQINAIDPHHWDSHDLISELTKALAHIDQAKSVHNQARARLSALRSIDEGETSIPADLEPEPPYEGEKGFLTMAKAGFAYSFPAILAVFVFLIFYLVLHHS